VAPAFSAGLDTIGERVASGFAELQALFEEQDEPLLLPRPSSPVTQDTDTSEALKEGSSRKKASRVNGEPDTRQEEQL
jgi:hypothetical protein